MKVDISHSQTLPTNDLLNLPDIDGVFNEVKGPSVPQPSQTASLMTVGSSSSSMHNNTATVSRSTTARTTR